MEKEKTTKAEPKAEPKTSETLKLNKAIVNFGKEVDTLEFHPITGGDCRKLGMPFSFNTSNDVIINEPKVAKLIERSAKLEDGGADKLSAGDFMRASHIILGFFQ